MYVQPDFGTTQWIAEYCSTMGVNPDVLIGVTIFVGFVAIISFVGIIQLSDDIKKLKKFIINENLMQDYEENIKKDGR